MVRLTIVIQSAGYNTHESIDIESHDATSRDLSTLWSDIKGREFASKAKVVITEFCRSQDIDPTRVFTSP